MGVSDLLYSLLTGVVSNSCIEVTSTQSAVHYYTAITSSAHHSLRPQTVVSSNYHHHIDDSST